MSCGNFYNWDPKILSSQVADISSVIPCKVNVRLAKNLDVLENNISFSDPWNQGSPWLNKQFCQVNSLCNLIDQLNLLGRPTTPCGIDCVYVNYFFKLQNLLFRVNFRFNILGSSKSSSLARIQFPVFSKHNTYYTIMTSFASFCTIFIWKEFKKVY